MKKSLIIISCFYCLISTQAQQRNENLNLMIAAEYSFASSAAKIGTHAAFLQFIADDGILFRPTPLNGKKYLTENNKPYAGTLSWYPSFAFMSKSGDLGLTTGPWEYKHKVKDSIATSYGNFCTVWQKQINGGWKFAIDFGNDNDKPTLAIHPLKVDSIKSISNELKKGLRRERPDELISLDKQLNILSATIDIALVYEKFISEDSRLLRNGSFPLIGTKSIKEYFSSPVLKYKFSPGGGKISSAKDFGFTYGTLHSNDTRKNLSERFAYMHVWKKIGKHWILLLDVINKIPD